MAELPIPAGQAKIDQDEIDDHMARIYAFEMEALQHAYALIPWGTKWPLSDGRWAMLRKFFEPKIIDGHVKAGFDIAILPTKDAKSGDCGVAHIEFMIERTGGGGPTVEGIQSCKTP